MLPVSLTKAVKLLDGSHQSYKLILVSRNQIGEGWCHMGNENYLVKDDTTFLSIIDSLPNVLIITNPDLSIRYVNTAFTRLTGFTFADVKDSRAPYLWWPVAFHQEYLNELSVVKTGKKHKSDWLFKARDGHLFWIKADVAPVVKEGRVLYMLAAWADITVNKETEAALRQELEGRKTV
jgi:PAS domain S-box-containing protein